MLNRSGPYGPSGIEPSRADGPPTARGAGRSASLSLRNEALKLLDSRGAVLELAREVTRLTRRENISGAVIGGIAVVLHGYVRTTTAVDVFIDGPLREIADVLIGDGFEFDPQAREFQRGGVPARLVTRERTGRVPRERTEIDGVATVGLADLIEMKLASGGKDLLRAIDLADVIGLMRRHSLKGDFARRLDKTVRPMFRKLARALAREG